MNTTERRSDQEIRYAWHIEIVAEREEESSLRVRFEGTHAEATRKADRLADGAPYEVRECILHRCGNLSSNDQGQTRSAKNTNHE